MNQKYDVIIAGAGLAGLSAAYQLRKAGLNVKVLEARDRVGGRVKNILLRDGTPIEIGGQWAGLDHTTLKDLAKEVGVETFKGHLNGEHLFWNGETLHRFREQNYPLSPEDQTALDDGIARLETLANSLDPTQPWVTANAKTLDTQIFAQWLNENVERDLPKRLLNAMIESLTAAAPHEYSALHAAFMLAMSGGLDHLFTPELSLAERFVGGSQLICTRLAEKLGYSVLLNAPLESCTYTNNEVTVTTPQGTFRAWHLILAMPPVVMNRILFTPPLPAKRRGLQYHLPQGTVIKFIATYKRPFWREKGLSGWVNSVEPPFYDALDNSPPDSHLGVLTTFIVGETAREISSWTPEQRKTLVLEQFAKFYGEEALNANEFFELDWNAEIYSEGGYQGNFVLGGWTAYGETIREAIGPIHFAGSETSGSMYGHMEGAVKSGYRAAQEVQAKLQSEKVNV
jgi:monoamine oxidase